MSPEPPPESDDGDETKAPANATDDERGPGEADDALAGKDGAVTRASTSARDANHANDESASAEPVDLSKAPKLGRRPVLIFAGAALGLYALFGPKLPREQRIRVPLGSARATAREARIAWWSTAGEPLREASFSFAPGEAPEALIHELRLPDGDYDVDVEIVLMEGRTASRKRVTVSGATTTLDVSFRP